MKNKTTSEYLINEVNKNEIAKDLIHCYEDFLIKIMDSNKRNEIQNFLKIIKAREQYLLKTNKIF